MTKIIRGTGITKRVLVPFQTWDDLDRVAERRGFEGKVAELEQVAREILVEAGYDPANVQLRQDENNTPAEYACEFVNRIRHIRAEIAAGRADRAARWGIELGYLCCEFAMKLEWERPALFGQANLASLDRGRENANGSPIEKRRRWASQCAAFDAAVEGGLKETAAYEAAAYECSVSSKTIRRSVKRRNQNL